MASAFRLVPWNQVAKPHADVTGGALDMGTYAVNLANVFRGASGVPDVYSRPDRFFATTYFASGMRSLLRDVFSGLSGGSGDRVLQLRTPFGGGKTHSLVALLHLARARSAAARIEELKDLPDPGTVRVVVLSGEELDPVRPSVATDGTETHTLWGELGAQLGRFEVVAEHDRLRSAPGGEALREVLGDGPVLILLDEVLVYVEKAMAVPQAESTLGRQAMLFMQALTEVVNERAQAVMVYSLQASAGEAAGAEGLLTQLDHLVSRIDAKREPVSGDEVMRVIQRRLFADLGDSAVHRQVATAYADLLRRQLHATAETAEARREAVDEAVRLEQRVLSSYPFHPALLDLMYHRWGSLPSYQRTRGALQFLACVTHDLWKRGEDSALIGPGDINLGDEPTRGAFFTQIGERERYQSVLDADVVSEGSGAATVDRRIGLDSPALAQLRVGSRMATAIMLYSFGSREGEDRGVLESDLVVGTLVPGLDRNIILAALHDLRDEELFLHYTGRRYRYEPTYNLTKLVRDEANKYSADEVLLAVREALEGQLRGARNIVLWPASPEQIRDRVPAFQFAYLHPDWDAQKQPLDDLLTGKGTFKREFQNGVAFLIPDAAQFDRARAAARLRLACSDLLKRRAQMGFSSEQHEELKEKLAGSERDLNAAVGQAYARVSIPVKADRGDRPYAWQDEDLRGLLTAGRTLHQRVLEALSSKLFETVAIDRLLSLIGLADRGFVAGPDVVNSFYKFFDFVKLADRAAIQQAIAAGITDRRLAYCVKGQVEGDRLAIPDPSLIRAEGLIPPEEIDLGPGSFVMTPALATSFKPAPAIPPPGPGAGGELLPPLPEEPPPPPPPGTSFHNINLRTRLNQDQLFALHQALSSLRDKSSSVDVEVTVRAAAKPEGYKEQSIKNGVIEPLLEAGVEDLRVDQT